MTAEQATFLLNITVPNLENEMRITRRVIEYIPEEKRDYKPDPRVRTAFELAWHLVYSERWFYDGIINGQFDQNPEAATADAGVKSVADIAGWYDRTVKPQLAQLRGLGAEQLTRVFDFFGIIKEPAVLFLNMSIAHSIHHRGQLSTYLRAMGARVPDIYGGSLDEPFQMPTAQG